MSGGGGGGGAASSAADGAAEAVKAVRAKLHTQYAHEAEFLQTVDEVLASLGAVLAQRPEFVPLLEKFFVPERIIVFRVPWTDDAGAWRTNTGYRVQFSSAIGPYKGGLRFHPTVTLSVLKFLACEQVLKNSLTTLPLGGGKGGSDFDPKGKSDREVAAFAASFMTELHRHVGADTDVPAGDIGVGAREIGYLFGQYKRLANRFEGVLTGKAFEYGGSRIRPEATGYGLVYFTRLAMGGGADALRGKRVLVSGAGNVAQYAIEKLLDVGAVPLTASDSGGYVYFADGIDRDALRALMALKNERRGRLSELADALGADGAARCAYHGDGA
eukprot:CAMPEP_0198341298 /NCGR_PEP_ID=MMETSP1450-20131203/47197_1 /TAXON_ID=753684 ORGANISM="Madagascaria erythrocladiodes, Strain CCMP3234" /NCGR_SAMPLE_ID=MMETSP1450 /ASSEMBLY_ACC=CAM_ASM_001115 /LENGTH=328 /DNA_ID=CAMNT_0044046317 /DNA_START=38 /DNA_END=1021 /DNA_ORIENTATION=+